MADFKSPDLGISTNELCSPGYVAFDCARWDLPDNTTGKTGKHVVYRPLAVGFGYRGQEHVTDAMRTAVRAHYAAELAAEKAAEDAKSAELRGALSVLEAVPAAAAAELAAAQRASNKHWAGMNEGGDGYCPHIGWTSRTGREIAARHGIDSDTISAAIAIIDR